MRRLFAGMLLAVLLVSGFALANPDLRADVLALSMARYIPQMQDVAASTDASNGAVWRDARLGEDCTLDVHGSEMEAQCFMLAQCSKKTAVRAVGCCTVSLESSLPLEEIQNYEQVLADLLDVDLKAPAYILNVNTGKFHVPYCTSVEDMKDSNKLPCSAERALVLDYDYVPCKRCCP